MEAQRLRETAAPPLIGWSVLNAVAATFRDQLKDKLVEVVGGRVGASVGSVIEDPWLFLVVSSALFAGLWIYLANRLQVMRAAYAEPLGRVLSASRAIRRGLEHTANAKRPELVRRIHGDIALLPRRARARLRRHNLASWPSLPSNREEALRELIHLEEIVSKERSRLRLD